MARLNLRVSLLGIGIFGVLVVFGSLAYVSSMPQRTNKQEFPKANSTPSTTPYTNDPTQPIASSPNQDQSIATMVVSTHVAEETHLRSTPVFLTPIANLPFTSKFKQLYAIYTDTSKLLFSWLSEGQTFGLGGEQGVTIWSAENGQLIRSMPFDVYSLARQPHGDLLAIGTISNTTILVNPSTGQEVRSLAGPMNLPPQSPEDIFKYGLDQGAVIALAWSPDGQQLATARAKDMAAIVWDATTGDLVRGFSLVPQYASPLGENLGLLGWSQDARLFYAQYGDKMALWDTTTGRELPYLGDRVMGREEPSKYTMGPYVWSPVGRYVAALDYRVIRLWDVDAGKIAHSLPENTWPLPPPTPTVLPPIPVPQATVPLSSHPTPPSNPDIPNDDDTSVRDIAWSPDGATLVSVRGPALTLWDPATGKKRRKIDLPGAAFSVAWSPDGKTIACASRTTSSSDEDYIDITVTLWDPSTGDKTGEVPAMSWPITPQSGWDNNLQWSPDSNALAFIGGSAIVIYSMRGRQSNP